VIDFVALFNAKRHMSFALTSTAVTAQLITLHASPRLPHARLVLNRKHT